MIHRRRTKSGSPSCDFACDAGRAIAKVPTSFRSRWSQEPSGPCLGDGIGDQRHPDLAVRLDTDRPVYLVSGQVDAMNFRSPKQVGRWR